MPNVAACTETETHALEEILHRVASNLGLLMDHEIAVGAIKAERWDERPAGAGGVHISFKMAFQRGAARAHGCLLLPLAESITLAGYLTMLGDEEVAQNRTLKNLDRATKDALLELSNFVASAVESALIDFDQGDVRVHTAGCQGVRAGVRPALEYSEGDALVVGRSRMSIHEYPEFEALLLLPDLAVESR